MAPTPAVGATVTYDGATRTALLVPSSALSAGTAYTATVKGGPGTPRAEDLAGNPVTGVSWTFTTDSGTPPSTCPCSAWSSTTVPANPADNDPNAVEVGVKFRTDVNGYITGVRFYKGTGNTGTHIGNLWTTTGQLLASATFTNETASGWQQVNFGTPVAVTANTVYVASYFAPNGHYAADSAYFANSGVNNGVGAPAAKRRERRQRRVPVRTREQLSVVEFQRQQLLGGCRLHDRCGTRYDAADCHHDDARERRHRRQRYRDSPCHVQRKHRPDYGWWRRPSSCAMLPMSLSLRPSPTTRPLVPQRSRRAARWRLRAAPRPRCAAAAPIRASRTWLAMRWPQRVVVLHDRRCTSSGCPCSAWPPSALPTNASVNDTAAVELGVKFRTDVSGYITGVRFYKGTGNTGTHIGNLWTSDGQLLATATFINETATGWQQVNFGARRWPITANTVYVASYFAPNGSYAGDNAYFANAGVDNRLVHLLQNGVSGGNGVYQYGAPASFPSLSFNATNYWVDVVFTTVAPARHDAADGGLDHTG